MECLKIAKSLAEKTYFSTKHIIMPPPALTEAEKQRDREETNLALQRLGIPNTPNMPLFEIDVV